MSTTEKPVRTHELKIWPTYFDPMIEGRMQFQVRDNTDRSFQTGERVRLREWDNNVVLDGAEPYTGREAHGEITYVMTTFGVSPGHAVIGVRLDAVIGVGGASGCAFDAKGARLDEQLRDRHWDGVCAFIFPNFKFAMGQTVYLKGEQPYEIVSRTQRKLGGNVYELLTAVSRIVSGVMENELSATPRGESPTYDPQGGAT